MSLRVIDYGHEFHVMWDYDVWHKRNLEAVKSIEPVSRCRRHIP